MENDRADDSLATTPFTLEQVTSLDPNNETSMQAYMWALQTFAPCVTGRKEWNENYLAVRVSSFLSKSDEAFMLVTLEKQWDRWHDMFLTKVNKSSGVHVFEVTLHVRTLEPLPRNAHA